MRWLVSLMVLLCGFAVFAQDEELEKAEIKHAEAVLKQAGMKSDGASLLEFFKERTPSESRQKQLAALIDHLGHDSFREREQTTYQLFEAGQQALPFLQKGLKAEDEEIVRRSEICLEKILAIEEMEIPKIHAAVRLLVHHKPEGAAKALLDFLPFIYDQALVEHVREHLPAVVVRGGKPVPAALEALGNDYSVRRGLAGAALAEAGQGHAVLKLLDDPDPDVRLFVAHALTLAQEPEAVPVLIALLDQMSPSSAWLAEDLLHQLAADKAPDAHLGANVPAAQVRKAWEKWWQQHQNQADVLLKKLAEAPQQLGLTVITQMSANRASGEISEVDRRGQVRWKVDNLRYPVDAKVVGPNQLVVAEYLDRRVTKRDFKGQIIWTHTINMPLACQPLPNGNTFIVSRQMLVEVDRNGKQVFSQKPPINVNAAYKMRNGHIVMITTGQSCIRMDAQGKNIKEFNAGPVYPMGGNIEVLPNNRILVPEYNKNRVVEYTPDGKVFWEANVRLPTSVQRLANGNTLVVSMTDRRVLEINPAGRTVWEQQTDGQPWSARRR